MASFKKLLKAYTEREVELFNTNILWLKKFYKDVKGLTTDKNHVSIFFEAKELLHNFKYRLLFTQSYLHLLQDVFPEFDRTIIEREYQKLLAKNKGKSIRVPTNIILKSLPEDQGRVITTLYLGGIRWQKEPDNTDLNPFLLAASVEFDVSKKEILRLLVESGFNVESLKNPMSRLTPDMYIKLFRLLRPDHLYESRKDESSKPKGVKLSKVGMQKKEKKDKKDKKKAEKQTVKASPVKNLYEINAEKQAKYSGLPFTMLRIGKPEIEVYTVPWSDIVFEDFQIKVRYGNHYSFPFLVSESRKSFKLLSKYLAAQNLSPLIVSILNNTVKKIDDLQELKNVFHFLRIKEEFFTKNAIDAPVDVKVVMSHLSLLPGSFIERMIRSKSVQDTIDYLCERHDKGLKIVPAFEIVTQGESFREEDTFIFTIDAGQYRCLIWESTVKGRATYIFLSSESRYEETLQMIFDYIASAQKSKRMKISGNDPVTARLQYLTKISHYGFEQWKVELEHVLAEI